jgi:hypothetical protein
MLAMNPPKEQPQPDPTVPQEQRQGNALPKLPKGYDPIENAMRRHPGLTREKAEEMAEAFGF